MVKVNVATLKANLSKYLEMAQKGTRILVTSHGEEVAKIVPAQMVTSKLIQWKQFLTEHPPIRTTKKGTPAAQLIGQIRDEE